MCNLYRMTKGTAEVARLFAVEADLGANYAQEVYPGYPGLVIVEGWARAMNWGFPLVLKGRQGQPLKPKPVTNAREDKLLTGFWRGSFVHRRCLVPVSQWAEPRGEARRMTRSWYALSGPGPFAVAGLWRSTPDWGDCYTMVMTESAPAMDAVHDWMPVILRREDWAAWRSGTANQALALCQTWSGELAIEHAADRWVDGKPLEAQPGLL